MILNSSRINSAESKMTASWHLTYNKAQVQDKDLLKVLDLLNHAQLDLPELKKSKLLSAKDYFKTDIFLDRNFFARKSSSDLNIASIEDDSGLKGIRLHVENETWNINKPVTAKKIKYSSYLTEDATMEEFLATLDKKRSVLYKILTSFTN